MKKATIIIVFIGFCCVVFGYYFAEKSSKLISESKKNEEILSAVEANRTENIRNQGQLKNNTINYQQLELDEADYTAISPCLQAYKTQGKLLSNCDDELLKIIIEDFEEEGMVNAIIGETINYSSFAFNHNFFSDLFHPEASLKSKLTLSFLNQYRNPEKLQQIFNQYKYHIYKHIPKQVYQKIFEEKLTECIAAYKEIESKTDKEAFLKDIYFKADTQNLHDTYWSITFWKRRSLEKNDKILYAILKEIQEHYSADDC